MPPKFPFVSSFPWDGSLKRSTNDFHLDGLLVIAIFWMVLLLQHSQLQYDCQNQKRLFLHVFVGEVTQHGDPELYATLDNLTIVPVPAKKCVRLVLFKPMPWRHPSISTQNRAAMGNGNAVVCVLNFPPPLLPSPPSKKSEKDDTVAACIIFFGDLCA